MLHVFPDQIEEYNGGKKESQCFLLVFFERYILMISLVFWPSSLPACSYCFELFFSAEVCFPLCREGLDTTYFGNIDLTNSPL